MGLRKAGAWLGLVEDDGDDASSAADGYADGGYGADNYDADNYGAGSYADGDQALGQEPSGAAAQAGHGFRIASVQAQNFRDAHTIGEYFRQDIPVIINLTDMTAADAKRIVDFASGLIFGRQGDIERLSSRVFLIIPPDFQLLKEPGALTDEGFFNQA